MNRPPRLDQPARRTLMVATLAAGVAIGAALRDHPQFALVFAAIAAASALSVLRHLLNRENVR